MRRAIRRVSHAAYVVTCLVIDLATMAVILFIAFVHWGVQ